jgi:hypothetical protein
MLESVRLGRRQPGDRLGNGIPSGVCRPEETERHLGMPAHRPLRRPIPENLSRRRFAGYGWWASLGESMNWEIQVSWAPNPPHATDWTAHRGTRGLKSAVTQALEAARRERLGLPEPPPKAPPKSAALKMREYRARLREKKAKAKKADGD